MARSLRTATALLPACLFALVACSEPTSPDSTDLNRPDLTAIELPSTPITNCGTVITVPGRYYLARDLNNCPGHGIEILSSDVELRLKGRSISGALTGAYGINIGARPSFHGGVARVTIQGPGLIQSFAVGISMEQVSYSKVEGVTSRSNLHGLTLNRSWANGDLLPSHHDSILGNNFTGNRAHGVTMNGGQNSVFYRNRSADNGYGEFGGNGFYLFDADGITLRRNEILRNGTYGIRIEVSSTENLVTENYALYSAGFDLSEANPGCDHNIWMGNTFGIAQQPCVH